MASPSPKPALAKVNLRNREGETESVWCTVVDAAKGLFRIVNIPMLRVRPTYGDVIVATPDREAGLAFRRTHKIGGYWVDVLEYKHKATFQPLAAWLEKTHGIVCEGIEGPQGDSPGVLGVAVPKGVSYSVVGKGIDARFPDVWPLGSRPEESQKEPSPARTRTAALHHAVKNGDVKALRKALADGAKVNAKNEQGQTPALVAAMRGDAKTLTALRSAGANLRVRNDAGDTGLHLAAADGQTAIARVLLAAGVDPNDRRNRFQAAPLHLAAIRDQADAAKLLLRAGARLDLRDHDDLTPLMCAAGRSSMKTARVLLPQCAGKDRSEALQVAARAGDLAMVKLLLVAGADAAYRSPRGNTALMLARSNKKAKSVVKLLAELAVSSKGGAKSP
jgi:ankyrin repeat protein